LRQFDKEIFGKAIKETLNRVGAMCVTVAKKQITDEYNVRKKDLKVIKLVRAKKWENSITIQASGGKIPLLAFQARQTARGVTIRIKKSGISRSLIPSAFITAMKFSQQVFERIRLGGMKRVPRGPVEALWGPGIPDLFGSKKVMDAITKTVNEKSQEIFNHSLDYFSGRTGLNVSIMESGYFGFGEGPEL
jgi:hypothetical protein